MAAPDINTISVSVACIDLNFFIG